MARLPEFYLQQFQTQGTTDIVLFGDCRPVHRPAIELAKATNVQVHVFEEGYFRPYWITLERGGVNGNSSFPQNPEWYRNRAKNSLHYDNGHPFRSPFWKRAAHDIGYNFWAGLNPLVHRGVKSHVPHSPFIEYCGYLTRGIKIKLTRSKSTQIENQLISEANSHPFFLLPLQLAHDAQIVHHSPFENMASALRVCLESFARSAPRDRRLAVKIHPLDPGLVNYSSILRGWCRQLNICDRVFFLESGNLPKLLSHTAGVVTVNSTVGGSALVHARPLIALGRALYNLPGLTFQGNLDEFWEEPPKPDMNLFRNFRDVVIRDSQVNGGFYCREGISLAITNSIPRLLSDN